MHWPEVSVSPSEQYTRQVLSWLLLKSDEHSQFTDNEQVLHLFKHGLQVWVESKMKFSKQAEQGPSGLLHSLQVGSSQRLQSVDRRQLQLFGQSLQRSFDL